MLRKYPPELALTKFNVGSRVFCRFRTSRSRPSPKHNSESLSQHPPAPWKHRTKGGLSNKIQEHVPTWAAQPKNGTRNIIAFFEENVDAWAQSHGIRTRLSSFGVESEDVTSLLALFAEHVRQGNLSKPPFYSVYTVHRFWYPQTAGYEASHVDLVYSTIFHRWITLNQEIAKSRASPEAVDLLCRIADSSRQRYPHERFTRARSLKRKVIMHVGPTNSGKTHNALRALAAADTGVYAGPLRLLAHEIWQRLNSGQIPPLGVDPNVSSSLSDPEELADSALDMAHEASDMRQRVNPEWVRPCNLITGEECRIVGPDAMLTSCTVEMLDYTSGLDVGVVDEIQMIGDELRGSAWTDAVLGLAVRELHLCGEETAVPLVRKLLEPTGDTLVINRYERLTPLVVEEKSLNGDLSRVQKGDCVVAFSRKDIFSLSNAIRSATNMRCAVVYGALPPETRSSQAALFNNPDSGYDVLVGSDAIGMGLNLKIRRVVFQRLGKWDGIIERSLTVSQTKQIAGRAGRFGLGDGSAGYVTTLYEKDLPVLRSLMSQTPPVLVAARLGYDLHRLRAVTKILPPSASVATVYTALKYTADVASQFAMQEASSLGLASDVLDKYQKALIPDDVDNFMLAPFPWRNDNATPQIRNLIASYLENHHVGIRDMVRGTALIESLQRAEQRMAAGGRPWQGLLPHMERFHKLLVTYLWLALRNPVIYSDVSWCVDLKERVEGVLDWNLRLLSKADNDQPLPPTPSSGIDYQPHAFIVRARESLSQATHAS